MSVIYDQLKRVEETQTEESLPVEGEEVVEDLPLEEELEHQQSEKFNVIKGYLIKLGAGLAALGLVLLVVFIITRKPQPSKQQVVPSIAISSEQMAKEAPIVSAPAKSIVQLTVPQKAQKRRVARNPENKKVVPVVVVEKPTLKTKQEAKVEQVVKPETKTKKVEQQKVSPEMLAKAQKPLPPIQVAQQYYQVGALNKAIKAYNKVLETDDNQLESYNNLGVIYTRKGLLAKAESNFREALKINAYYAEAHYNFAVLSEKRGKNKQALGHYLKFIEYARPKHQEMVKRVKEHVNFN